MNWKEEARRRADAYRRTGSKGNIEYADLIDLLVSDNDHAIKIRKWMQEARLKVNLCKAYAGGIRRSELSEYLIKELFPFSEHEILLMASYMRISGNVNVWEKATVKERRIHARKVKNAARRLAAALSEEIKPYYPVMELLAKEGFHPAETANICIDLPTVLKGIAEHAEKAVYDERRLKTYDQGKKDRRIFVMELSGELRSHYREVYGEVVRIPNGVLASCVAIMFPDEVAPSSEEVGRMLGER